ncbi:hypothetical protein ACFY74_08630 [Streptomyces massasporeus]|uniref:hypothetical protein n=2 Tax=Streptomyces massasporeus TaxID=67324 RepID=UPI0036C4972D
MESAGERSPRRRPPTGRAAALLKKHSVHDSRRDRPFFVNETRGQGALFKTKGGDDVTFEIMAKGRSGWTGWVKLVRDDLEVEPRLGPRGGLRRPRPVKRGGAGPLRGGTRHRGAANGGQQPIRREAR